MKPRLLFFFSIIIFTYTNIFSQITDKELGKSNIRTGLYDFSEPGAINIKVAVWGYIARPGKYIVPDYTTVSDLISFAGGPSEAAEMDDLRVFRTLENGKEEIIKFNYDDVLWGSGIEVKNRLLPKLEASDILIVPGSPRLFFMDWFRLGLQIFGVLLSVVNIYLLIQYSR